ncbi:FkbM family methyltransferase [Actinomycetospora sp. C-140]
MTTTAPLPRLAPAPPRLAPWRRARVLARRTLHGGLRAVPAPVVDAVHDRWIGAAGERDRRWRLPASALYYRPLPHATITVPGGRGERLEVVGSRTERVLWWFGEQGYEAAEAAWWRRLCAGARDVLEIGANIGYYSVVGAAAAPVGAYTAVEAQPDAAAIVRRNLDLNGLHHATVLAAAAVGDGAPDHLELALPDQESHQTAPTGSYLRESAEGVDDRAARRSVTVRTTPASELFAGRDLVKLDIEGSEADVLTAARPAILASRPVLLVEVLGGARRLHGVLADLLDHDYRLLAPTGAGARPLRLAAATGPGHRDVLLVPEERGDEL